MKFIYADELKNEFDVFGHFYNVSIGKKLFQCRSLLEIVSKSVVFNSGQASDAVVVMMNPGSSVPLDKKYSPKRFSLKEIFSRDWEKEVIPIRPDNAQYQIMRLMILNDWKYVKVLNLSDLRNGHSGAFRKAFEKASLIDPTNPHCITHQSRRVELKNALRTKSNGVVVAAWGSVEVLRDSAHKMIELVPNLIGLKLDGPWYRYASPYKKDQKMNWLNKIDAEVKKA